MLLSFIISFLVKSTLTAALLLCYYMVFLRNKQMHQFNRFYLLGTVLVSLLVPFLQFEWLSFDAPQATPDFPLLPVTGKGAGEEIAPQLSASNNYIAIFLYLTYSAVAIALLSFLIVKIAAVYRMKKANRVEPMNGYDMVFTSATQAPFSFMNNVFWREEIALESREGSRILEHELTHIRQYHSLDKLTVQVISAICWLNPCYWFIQKELSQVHEFIADDAAIHDKDTEAFARMLLQTHYGDSFRDVVHPFFHSSIKRRLSMLTQLSKPKYAQLRRLMVLPVIAASVLLFSFKVNTNGNVNRSNKRIKLALDAGHGGPDRGAVDLNGMVEKDLNLMITNRLIELADQHNIAVIPTHTTDEYITLPQRAVIANKGYADVFVSIHVNSVNVNEPQDKSGYQMVLDERNAKASDSRMLASAIAFRIGNMDIQTELKEKHLLVLRNAEMPAILIECGYINNAKEMAMLRDKEQLDRLCTNILNGIVDYNNRK